MKCFWLTILLFASAEAGMPTWVNNGGGAASISAITPALPASILTNDILLLFVETANDLTQTSIANQNGGTWTQVTNSPQGIGPNGGTSATRLAVFWSRYNGTQGAPTTNDAGNHQIGFIAAFRDVKTSGDPWNITSGGTIASDAPVTITLTGATTSSDNCLVVLAVANDMDINATTIYSNWTNTNLASVTERFDGNNNQGNGGGLGMATGEMATAGNYGNSTVDQAAGVLVDGFMTIALEGTAVTDTYSGRQPRGVARGIGR